MGLPFTEDQFFAVFRDYNEAVWPAPVVLTVVAVVAVALALRPRPWSGVMVSVILALLWGWAAIAYHLAFFARVNPLAPAFAALSAVGMVVFLWLGVVRRRLRFGPRRGWRTPAGLALVVYALVAYPILSVVAGHSYPAMPTFGLPCPTTLFSVGILALLVPPYPWLVCLVPVLWSVVGAQAAFLLGVPQDLALLVAAGVGGVLIRWRTRAGGGGP
jgi:Family of unknown function (DUF6064)